MTFVTDYFRGDNIRPPEAVTVNIDSVIKDFSADSIWLGLSPTTARSYAGLARKFLRAHPNHNWADFKHETVVAYLNRLMVTPALHKPSIRLPSSVDVNRKALKCLFAWAVSRGWLDSNPAEKVRRIKHKDRPIVPPQPNVVRAILEAIKAYPGDPELRARNLLLVLFAIDTGARLSEMLNLDIQNVWDGTQPVFPVTLNGKGGRWRWTAMSGTVVDALRAYIEVRRPKPGQPALFLTETGERVSTTAARNLLLRLCDAASVKRMGWHQFRRFHASKLRAAHVNESDSQMVLGMTEQTWRRYTWSEAAMSAVTAQLANAPTRMLANG